MSYSISYSATALRRLDRLDVKTRLRIRAKIAAVAEDPKARNPNLDHLTGMDGYRLRVGGWRIIFDLDHGSKSLLVQRVRERGGAYDRRRK